MFHVQPHRYTGEFNYGVIHPATRSAARSPELVRPSRLKWAGEHTGAMQHDRVEAVAASALGKSGPVVLVLSDPHQEHDLEQESK